MKVHESQTPITHDGTTVATLHRFTLTFDSEAEFKDFAVKSYVSRRSAGCRGVSSPRENPPSIGG